MPVVAAICTVALNIALSATFLPNLGARGLLLANGIASFLNTFVLTALLWRRIGGIQLKPILLSLLRIALASLAMSVSIYWIHTLGFVPATTLSSRIWYLTGQLGIGSAVFLGTARLLGVEELSIAFRALMQKFVRGSAIARIQERR